MSWYSGGYGYFRQPTTGELLLKADASIARLRNQGRDVHPVRLKGTKIAQTWWGCAWVDNLERYADYANRVGRGKKYVRAGCVIDLTIRRGHIHATVQGSRQDPYEVDIDIEPLSNKAFEALLARCSMRARSLDALVEGDFPQELKDSLTAKDGIFPAPRQIRFNCNCPDWARMCKHVAAAIMAVAPQLDDNPLLLFELRGVDTTELVQRTVEQKLNLMLANADKASERIIDLGDDELTHLFGVL